MTEISKPTRAMLGLVAIVVLFFVVLGFWNQYRVASRVTAENASPAGEASTTPAAADTKPAEQSAAKPSTGAAKPKTGQKLVVVQIQGLNFRESPAPDANPIRGLDAGEKLVFISKDGSWYRVKDSKGIEGYVSANDQYSRLETVK